MGALKLQCVGHVMRKKNRLEKQIMLVLVEGTRRHGRARITLFKGIRDQTDLAMEQFNVATWCTHVMQVTRVIVNF